MSAEPTEEASAPAARIIRKDLNSARKSVILDPDESSGDDAEKADTQALETAEDEKVEEMASETHLQKRQKTKATLGPSKVDAEFMKCAETSTTKPEKYQGWLQKAAPNWMNAWSERWFVLEDQQLRWYKQQSDVQALGMLDFSLVPCEVEQLWSEEEPKNVAYLSSLAKREWICSPVTALFWDTESDWARFRICPVGSDRAFELQVRGKDKGTIWVCALLAHIQFAESKRVEKGSVPVFGKKWWKIDRISPSRFIEIADTGDIVLFRSKGALQGVIRAIGGGKYDHVGLVLKLAKGNIALLESTGSDGVGICTWKEFCENGWHLLYPILALRRVAFDRTPERLLALQKWCTQIIGKPYSLTFGKLMQRRSVSSGGDPTDEAFFCSQLVAEALKVLEVIPRGLSSTQFWPSTFSAANAPPIETREGCCFRQELTIDFSLDASAPNAVKEGAKKRDETAAWK